MVDSKENSKFYLGVKGLRSVIFGKAQNRMVNQQETRT